MARSRKSPSKSKPANPAKAAAKALRTEAKSAVKALRGAARVENRNIRAITRQAGVHGRRIAKITAAMIALKASPNKGRIAKAARLVKG